MINEKEQIFSAQIAGLLTPRRPPFRPTLHYQGSTAERTQIWSGSWTAPFLISAINKTPCSYAFRTLGGTS